MANIAQLLTEHIDIWTAADTEKKSGRGRASGNAGSVYGVKKLRELILELAVRGKLVPQDANDEPASELLKRIQAEKAKLIAEGKLKRDKPLASISEEEKPYDLPNGWEWQRLAETYYSISPRGNQLKGSEIQEEGKFPVVDQGQMFISGYTDNADLVIEIPQPLIVFGDHTTNLKLIDFDFVAGADGTKLLTPILIYPKFYFCYLNSYKLENRGYARHFKVLNDNLIAIPPIAEQHRIVAKVDELMALCDQLEQQHSNAQEAHETLVSQLLATLSQSQNATEFNANWQHIYAHFDVLFTTEASVDALKKTLLQLAVMGKLIPQDPNDEPASELLKRIQAEEAKLIAKGKVKNEKPLSPIGEDEKLFGLPQGWEWAIADKVANFIDPQPSHRTPPEVVNGVPYIGYSDISFDKGILFESARKVSNAVFEEHNLRYSLKLGDFVFGKIGTIGKPFFLSEPFNYCLSANLILIQPNIKYITPRFLAIFFDSPSFLSVLNRDKTNSTHAVFGIKKSREIIIPLPPLVEQHRIVAKVDVLMALCDQLKTSIQQTSQQQQIIADALVAQAVA